jgi:hypothetical protein
MDPRKCCTVIAQLLHLQNTGQYCISSEESIPGSLSYLLSIREGELVDIFKICGFYNDKKGVFLLAAFRTWIRATFVNFHKPAICNLATN